MITVFNQLTQSELTDYSLFENVLDNHFEKYRFFYEVMEPISLNDVKKICCECPAHGTELLIIVKFNSKKHLDQFIESFRSRLDVTNCFLADYFLTTLSRDGNSLNISIENKNISKEGEIYEDRFDSY